MAAPVAITGMGMITAQGVGVDASWQGVIEGREVLRPWAAGATHGLAPDHLLLKLKVAQCSADLPRPADLPPRLWNRLSRTQQLACIATDEALTQANLPRDLGSLKAPARVFLATTVAGMDQNERYYAQYRQDKNAADAALMRRLQPYEVGALIARRHGLAADCASVCLTTCVGSAMAIIAAADAIASGEIDVAIAGGSEALCRVVLSGFHALKVVAPDGCRPFDRNRPGMTVGEGAGILVLESARHVQASGIPPLAWLRGSAITCDAHHLTAPDPRATQPVRAISIALRRAGIAPEEIAYINAHGTGTRDNDVMESAALRSALRADALPPVSSTKRATGHTFAAAAAIEAIFCIQAIRHGIAPVNAGSVEPDPALDLPIVRGQSLRRAIPAALSTNFAFGGNNTALLFAQSPGPASAVSSSGGSTGRAA